MKVSIITKILNRIQEGSDRTVKLKKNVAGMIFIKGANILVSLLLVPLTLNYVDSDTYGVWLAISSMVGWISFFDIGINNGLRNKLTEAFANNNTVLAKKYVSTTYALLSLIFIPLTVILTSVAPFLNWNSILNVNSVDSTMMLISILLLIVYFCINFILSTINVVLNADMKPADSAFRVLIQQVLSLAVIYILTLFTEGSLIHLCAALCFSPLAVSILFNITLFHGRYKEISPSFKFIDFKVVPDLFKLGIQFFIIQIAFVVQFQLTNFLIIRYYGASDVTNYNIALKYFNIMYMLWNILITPLWSATTDAVARNDIQWIKRSLSKYIKLYLLCCVILVVQLIIANIVYRIWVGDTIQIPWVLSFWVMLYNLIMMFGSLFVQILNGAGILKVQSVACLISPVVFLGLFYTLYLTGCGVYSVLIAATVANFNGYLLAPVQCRRLIRKMS